MTSHDLRFTPVEPGDVKDAIMRAEQCFDHPDIDIQRAEIAALLAIAHAVFELSCEVAGK